jgi:hypothetical protein
MEVAWSKVGAIRRMLEDFPLLLLHDNARPHTANKTNVTLQNFKWEAVEREVTAWFRQQPKEFYAAGFQEPVKRWDKCLNVQGDYVEK